MRDQKDMKDEEKLNKSHDAETRSDLDEQQ